MKTQPISAVNFKRLYISDDIYNDYQKAAVTDIKTKLTPKVRDKLEKRGYDIFVNNSAYFNYEVYICAVKDSNPKNVIGIGSYSKNFDVCDAYRAIDKKEAQVSKRRAIGWSIIGTAAALLLAFAVARGCSKRTSGAVTSVVQKAHTELLDTMHSKIK